MNVIFIFNLWISPAGWFIHDATHCAAFSPERSCMCEMHIDLNMYL